MDKTGANDIARFLYEAGQLRRVARSGWWVAGVEHPEDVADHSFRAAILAGMLAKLEGADREKVLLMALYHDLPEARINDLHKVAQGYFDCNSANVRAAEDQAQSLPEPFSGEMADLARELGEEASREAKIVADADHLECLFTAREYLELGYPVQDWIDNNRAGLHTRAAKDIADAAVSQTPSAWWKGLKITHVKQG